MELELKHITPYLPYGLKFRNPFGIQTIKGLDTVSDAILIYYWDMADRKESHAIDCKLLLRPLSDLKKEIEHDGERFVPETKLEVGHWSPHHKTSWNDRDIYELPYGVIELLLSWHFDVFGLIEQGLAIPKE